MHFKNGRPAKNGDKVISIPSYGTPVVGILYDAVPGNNTCNGRLAATSLNDPTANLSECLHADDVRAASIPDTTATSVASSPPELGQPNAATVSSAPPATA